MLYAFFAACILVIIFLVALDLGVFHRRGHEHIVKMREALIWTSVWVSLALCFNVVVYFLYGYNWLGFRDAYTSILGSGAATQPATAPQLLSGTSAAGIFLSGYLLELSLSMDNLFVFAAILTYFRVPLGQQHRVLVWGIIGAIILRGAMIALGAALVHMFEWIFYVFGALLIWTAWKMLGDSEVEIHPERNIFIRIARRAYPTTHELHGSKFFVRMTDGQLAMTPLFLALILVDIADVIFAIDSIPAIFGIFDDARQADIFIVFTSNMFAVMGLRSMYFALIGLMHQFQYLKAAIVGLLAYIGVKMLLHDVLDIPNAVSLAVIFGVLGLGVIASLVFPRKPKHEGANSMDQVAEPVHPNDSNE
jgi:tellurite resistance protein TerC